jgi:hypothetical protein
MTTETNENGPTGNPEMDEKIRTIASDLQVASALCEAAAKHELRLSLFEIPQEEEDPMSVSVGLKQGGGILRFRIPFSF